MPSNHSDLIDKLGGPAAVAETLSVGDVNVRAWKMRSRVPPEHWPALIGMAGQKGVFVTAEWLMMTTPARKTPTPKVKAEAA